MGRIVIAVLAAAIAAVLGHQWLAGSAADLDPTLVPQATAVLAVAAGAGLAWRRGAAKGPDLLLQTVLLGVLALLRGWLCDLAYALGPPGDVTAAAAALLSLGPAGFCLGRILGGVLHGGIASLLLGACLGEAALRIGGAGMLPASVGTLAEVAALGLLARRAAARAEGAAKAAEQGRGSAPRELSQPHALLVGAAAGLLVLSLRRLVPAYVEPSSNAVGDALLALLGPAVIVAWPGSVLARTGWPQRGMAAAGGVLLALVAAATAGSLALYENASVHVALTQQLHLQAVRWSPLLGDWSAWLLAFSGVLAAALGVACGALRGRVAAGLFVAGAGLAAAAEAWLLADASAAVVAPVGMVLGAAGLAALAAPVALLPRAGWLALPVVVLPWLGGPESIGPELGALGLRWRTPAGFTEVRRPGEYGVDAFQRDPLVDVTVFRTPGPESDAIVGRAAWRSTCTARAPVVEVTAAGGLRANPGGLWRTDPEHSRHVGVRIGGIPLHAGHQPLGSEGSLGRLTRVFSVAGPAFVTGVGAELVAADLHDAGLLESATVSSPAPIGRMALHVLLEALGTTGWQAGRVEAPVPAARRAAAGGFRSVIVTPAREGWPGAGALCGREHLQRLARLLSADGRCLLWLDATDLSVEALRGRCAAFAEAFDERCAAFVEMRELDAPFVLLVGWRTEAGRPRAAELQARLPWPEASGLRSRLRSLDDLQALLLCDGPGLCAARWAAESRDRAIASRASGDHGWAAVAAVRDRGARLSRVVADAPDDGAPHAGAADEFAADELCLGLAAHARYEYDLADINETVLEIRPDVDWAAFDEEAARYARAAALDRDHPLLQLALAALLQPLAVSGDYGRFARVFTDCGAEAMRSWRLALLQAWVARSSLETEMAAGAVERARSWRREAGLEDG